ncbi:TRAP transporter large permease [Halalkalibacter oceani]|uniref:TRAP transporter large permease n=1 Tax=Halalkalibacter oceani TaxID=1653776 RepID=A0A9X2INE1_9BACI|nr:TRAP transporter large permease [Halalkalibacter oceani]MCM3714784.1 TRAP transporter large permease [Halalkalibacter oceani]
MTAFLFVFSLLFFVLLGMPIGFALAIVALLLLFYSGSVPLDILPVVLLDGANSFPLLAVPLFMLAGELMNATDISRRLIAFASSIVGFIRGGLAHVNIVTSMIFAEISGSATADAAALGKILIPEMKRKGYPAGFAAAVTSCSATMAILIPPSLPLILYGVMAGVSVAQLFIAGIIPGLLVGFGLMIASYIFARYKKLEIEQRFSLSFIYQAFKDAFWALLMPVIILGGILGGIFTPTEAAGVAVVVAFIIGTFIYRKLKWRDLPTILISAANQTAIVMIIIATSKLVGWYLTSEMIPQQLSAFIISLTDSQWVLLLLLNVFILIIGMFFHASAAIIMLVPILMPLINEFGIDPIHFGIMLAMNLAIGQQTPPVASVLLTTCSVGQVSLSQTIPYLKYFLFVMVVLLLIITYIPLVSLWLPALLA